MLLRRKKCDRPNTLNAVTCEFLICKRPKTGQHPVGKPRAMGCYAIAIARNAGINCAKATPRWLRRSFSSAVISAKVLPALGT